MVFSFWELNILSNSSFFVGTFHLFVTTSICSLYSGFKQEDIQLLIH